MQPTYISFGIHSFDLTGLSFLNLQSSEINKKIENEGSSCIAKMFEEVIAKFFPNMVVTGDAGTIMDGFVYDPITKKMLAIEIRLLNETTGGKLCMNAHNKLRNEHPTKQQGLKRKLDNNQAFVFFDTTKWPKVFLFVISVEDIKSFIKYDPSTNNKTFVPYTEFVNYMKQKFNMQVNHIDKRFSDPHLSIPKCPELVEFEKSGEMQKRISDTMEIGICEG